MTMSIGEAAGVRGLGRAYGEKDRTRRKIAIGANPHRMPKTTYACLVTLVLLRTTTPSKLSLDRVFKTMRLRRLGERIPTWTSWMKTIGRRTCRRVAPLLIQGRVRRERSILRPQV